MRIDVLSLFPESFELLKTYGVIGKAINSGKIELNTIDIRDFCHDKHRSADDTVFGGAAGMLMKPGPVVEAIESVRGENSRVIYLSPQGKLLKHQKAVDLSKEDHLILLCGHYEGIDSRVVNHFVDEEISIGDYVLTGGELPAMVLIDSVLRWVDGVLGSADSAPTDSLANGLLQYDEFTKPRNFRGYEVPEVLYSGDHKAVDLWRQESSLKNTREKRPDLYRTYLENKEDNH